MCKKVLLELHQRMPLVHSSAGPAAGASSRGMFHILGLLWRVLPDILFRQTFTAHLYMQTTPTECQRMSSCQCTLKVAPDGAGSCL